MDSLGAQVGDAGSPLHTPILLVLGLRSNCLAVAISLRLHVRPGPAMGSRYEKESRAASWQRTLSGAQVRCKQLFALP